MRSPAVSRVSWAASWDNYWVWSATWNVSISRFPSVLSSVSGIGNGYAAFRGSDYPISFPNLHPSLCTSAVSQTSPAFARSAFFSSTLREKTVLSPQQSLPSR